MKLSKNLSLSEVLVSSTAKRLGISNQPTKEHIENLYLIATKVFQPVRDHFKHSIYVSSGYRSKELNKAIKGSARRSRHMNGQALDLDADVYNGMTNAEIFYYIKGNLEFDKLLWEAGDDENPDWVHVSYVKGKNRGICLTMYRVNGRPNYKPFHL